VKNSLVTESLKERADLLNRNEEEGNGVKNPVAVTRPYTGGGKGKEFWNRKKRKRPGGRKDKIQMGAVKEKGHDKLKNFTRLNITEAVKGKERPKGVGAKTLRY